MSSYKFMNPKLRFNKFDNEKWENYLLGDVIVFYNTKRKPVKESDRIAGIYPYYGASGIVGYVKDYIFDGEYLLLSEDGANIVTRNLPIVYKAQGKFWVNNHAHIFKTKPMFSQNFLYQILEKINYIPFNSGTAQPKLNLDAVKNIPVNIPSLEEQQKIADFFTLLDRRIEKQQEKVEALREYKKGMLQKIFSRELRFKDENGETFPEWEEKKIGQLGSFKSGSGFSEKYQGYKNLEYPFIKVSDMNLKGNNSQIILSNHTVSSDMLIDMKLKPLKEPSIIFAKVGAAIFLERKRIVNKPFLIDNNMMAFSPISGNGIKFYAYLLETIRLSKFAQIGALPSYNASDLERIKVIIPSLKEQQKIADFLSKLDEKIEKEEVKLEALQEQKKGFMQQMFV